MSYGSLPPVPGLIPISALRKSPSCNNDLRECTPCAIKNKEVMGEQRPRRTGSQPSVDLIDIARRSRGYVDTPQAPPSGKARAARHRKSDRRRERREGRKRSSSKRREIVEEEKCVNPRVNPIFVWIRQEDTRIVEVKCEDYDKRNRIVLTKTAQGWRAIPRTETLVPNLKAAAAAAVATPAVDEEDTFKVQQTRRARKSNRVKRKSTAVQVDDDDEIDDLDMNESEEPTWNVPVNIESHLPSHTIKVQRKRSPSPEQINTDAEADDSNENVNTSVEHSYIAQVSPAECSAKKVCDVTPLDNLLAVAELEFNQQIQTEAWRESEGMQDLDLLGKESISVHGDQFESECERDEEDCDYNEEDENNLAMDDILNRLEQSLQSPDTLCTDLAESIMTEADEDKTPNTQVPDENTLAETVEQVCSTVTDDRPTDLSTTKKLPPPEEDLLPTDLSVPKKKPRSPSPRPVSPRPSSRCSETIQSPQPSGLPAVPHSPDVQVGTKTAYLESLLSSTSHKVPRNSDMRRLNEPIDFGKCRKSASPTVTCSEEINTCTSSTSRDGEPEPKRGRLDDITLRTILDAATLQNRDDPKRNSKSESSRLLELLTTEMEPDALTQLKQLHADPNINLPDPMLVPKDRLSLILMSPGKEIPNLLNQRPELRLPEALAFPHLLQDPDILVITISQLEMIIKKQTTINAPEKAKPSPTPPPCKKPPDLPFKPEKPPAAKKPPPPPKDVPPRVPDVCNDPNMMWLPYLHQLEMAAMAFGNGDFLKMISSFPPYSNQMSDVSQMFPLNRFPHPTFPLPPLPNNVSSTNPFEFPIWHESANYQQHQQRQLCTNGKPPYREYADKTKGHKFPAAKSQFAPAAMYQHAAPMPHQYMNLPPSAYQPPPPRSNIQIPQYNAILTQKNPLYAAKDKYPKSAPKYSAQKPHQVADKFKTPTDGGGAKRTEFLTHQQPMDLSGSTAKAKPVSLQGSKSIKFDDVPEVGSTTASIEDMTSHMQESQKHLWHPLFGNQKSSANPWNWTTVTATGE